MRAAVWILLIVGLPAKAGILDSTRDLEGKVVVIAGEVEELSCPTGGKYDCLSWPSGFLRFQYRDVCFTTDITACRITCNGFIATGKDKIPYFFVAEGLLDGLAKYPVKYYKCPNM